MRHIWHKRHIWYKLIRSQLIRSYTLFWDIIYKMKLAMVATYSLTNAWPKIIGTDLTCNDIGESIKCRLWIWIYVGRLLCCKPGIIWCCAHPLDKITIYFEQQPQLFTHHNHFQYRNVTVSRLRHYIVKCIMISNSYY